MTNPLLGAPGVVLAAFLFCPSVLTVPTAFMPMVLFNMWLLSARMVAPATEALSVAPELFVSTLRIALMLAVLDAARSPSLLF